MGADLAAAHFLVHRGAKVKFVGKDKWFERPKGLWGSVDLPRHKEPGYYLEAIDASDMELLFEGFLFFSSYIKFNENILLSAISIFIPFFYKNYF